MESEAIRAWSNRPLPQAGFAWRTLAVFSANAIAIVGLDVGEQAELISDLQESTLRAVLCLFVAAFHVIDAGLSLASRTVTITVVASSLFLLIWAGIGVLHDMPHR